MSKRKSYRPYSSFIFSLVLVMSGFLLLNFAALNGIKNKKGILKITFINTVKGRPLVLNDSLYTNVFGEPYRVSKFKYYISNPGIKNSIASREERSGHHLIDATNPASQSFTYAVIPGEYTALFFLVGVDSIHNCSGAQTGALDPLNDMYWTWNSGYVMAKLEGFSTVSSSINQRIEYHIGGYKGRDNVVQLISLNPLTPISISAGKTTGIIIETDISKWWEAGNPVTIRETPVCTTPGSLAKKIAANYSKMFTIQSVRND